MATLGTIGGELHLLSSDDKRHSCQKSCHLTLTCTASGMCAEQSRRGLGGGEAEPAPICFHYFFKLSLGCCFTKGAVLMLVLNCTSITNPVHCGESRGESRSSAVLNSVYSPESSATAGSHSVAEIVSSRL